MPQIFHILQKKEGLGEKPKGAPIILGTAEEDSTLTVDGSNVTWYRGINNVVYKWYRNNVYIKSGTTYLLTQSDVGSEIRVDMTFVDGESGFWEVPSNNTPPIANINDPVTGSVTISGTTSPGTTVSANTSGISDPDGLGSFSYQWNIDGVPIPGQTNSQYTIQESDNTKDLSVTVTYTDQQGTVETLTSVLYGVGYIGSRVYTTPGTYTFTVPTGVTSISAVCVGGGGGCSLGAGTSNTLQENGGGGGGLGWKNNIPVTPGSNITIRVGAGGTYGNGGDSYVINTSTVRGGGGGGGNSRSGGTYTGDGGGSGGAGGFLDNGDGKSWGGGGGGAGGYSGNGGKAGNGKYAGALSSSSGSGGGGGGGRGFCITFNPNGGYSIGYGGGVGIYGQGVSGAGVAGTSLESGQGWSGSGGGQSTNPNTTDKDPTYGGGQAGREEGFNRGMHGAVRILWGPGRAFPTSNVSSRSGEVVVN